MTATMDIGNNILNTGVCKSILPINQPTSVYEEFCATVVTKTQ